MLTLPLTLVYCKGEGRKEDVSEQQKEGTKVFEGFEKGHSFEDLFEKFSQMKGECCFTLLNVELSFFLAHFWIETCLST